MKKNNFTIYFLLLFTCNVFAQNKTTYIIYNAHIFTVNNKMDTAQAVVVSKGKFVAIGSTKHILQKYKSIATKINADGKYIYPGFIDAHCHFTGYALDKYKLNLYATHSFAEVVEAIQKYSLSHTNYWIEGRQWNQENWTNKALPNKDTLDKLFPSTPIFLLRIDGHAALCNQKALDIAGINSTTKIVGGEVQLNKQQPTGILLDNAIALVKNKIPNIDEATAIDYFAKTQEEFYQNGITSFSDCMVENNWLQWLQKAYQQHKVEIGSALYLTNNAANLQQLLQSPTTNSYNYHLAGIKVFADGSLGSRGAYLLQNYTDDSTHRGYLTTPIDSIKTIAKLLQKTPYQLCTHAIGDAANREILQLYAQYLSPKNNKRWRIEHAQVVSDSDIQLFGKYNIIPSVQPTHATSDMPWAAKRLGNARMKDAYAYKKLLAQNQWLPLGTDFPVEYLNPLYTFYAAVFRTDKNELPTGGFQSQEALTRQEALQGITIWAAKASFDELQKGSIELGKRADFVMLDINLLTATASQIYNAPILMTFIGGKKVYEKK